MASETVSKEITASANSFSLDDPPPSASSPYYLHASDNSSLRLVNEPLTGDNFHSWFRSRLWDLLSRTNLDSWMEALVLLRKVLTLLCILFGVDVILL